MKNNNKQTNKKPCHYNGKIRFKINKSFLYKPSTVAANKVLASGNFVTSVKVFT